MLDIKIVDGLGGRVNFDVRKCYKEGQNDKVVAESGRCMTLTLPSDYKQCLKVNNFWGVWSITSALNISPVTRLEQTWKKVSDRMMAKLDKFNTLMDRTKNFAAYRKKLLNSTLPCLPYVGICIQTCN
jgi:hypothetical protein